MSPSPVYTQQEVDALVARFGRIAGILREILEDATPDDGYYVVRPSLIKRGRSLLETAGAPESKDVS